MKTSHLLVTHPRPFPTESLSGYVLRLSGLNGYESPWSVLRLAEFQQCEMLRSGFDFERLSRIINWSAWNAGLLRDQFHIPELHVKEAKFCPDCVVENGYIEAHWSLPLMIACPIHRRSANMICPHCSQPISWYRPGLLVCRCGEDLRNPDLPPISDSEVTLLDLIRKKVLGIQAAPANPTGLPIRDLVELDLETLLQLVSSLARHRMTVDGCVPSQDARQAVYNAARILEDWPTNFTDLLRDFARSVPCEERASTTAKCKQVYRTLLGGYQNGSRKNTDFILSAIVEHGAKEWEYLDPFHMKRFDDRLPTGLVSAREFRLKLQNCSIGQNKTANSGGERTFAAADSEIKITDDRVLQFGHDDQCEEHIAAKILGVHQTVVHALISEGLCEVEVRPNGMRIFKNSEVRFLRAKLLDLAPQKPDCTLTSEQCVSLGIALSWPWDPPFAKAALIGALLKKKVTVLACFGDTIEELQMDRQGYHSFMGSLRRTLDQECMGAEDAAKELGCERALVPDLVHQEVLLGAHTPDGLRVTKKSIQEFTRSNTFLAAIAKKLHSSTESLVSQCSQIEIPITWLSRGGGRKRVYPFISSQDSVRLLGAISEKKRARNSLHTVTRSPRYFDRDGWT